MLAFDDYNDLMQTINRLDRHELLNVRMSIENNLAVIDMPPLDATERLMVRDDVYVEAIKAYCKRNDVGLKIAKDKVARYRADLRAEENKPR